MTDFPTFQDLSRVARDEALARNSNLTRDIIERQGSDANALVNAGVAVGDTVVGQLIRVNASLFLDSAQKGDLDRLVFDRYGLLRKAASPAVVTVQFTTTASVVSGFPIPAGTRMKTSDGIVFVTKTPATFPSGSTGPISVPAQSLLAGLSQQARGNTIVNIVDTIAGAPADIKVNNPQASAGASDDESDQSLRDRARRFYTTARRGTLSAIEAGGLNVPGVQTASAFEIIEPTGAPARLVELVITDTFTEQLVDATTIPASYPAQSQLIAQNVRDGLQDVRAGGIQVIVTVANVVLLGVSLALRFKAGSDIDAATQGAKTAMVGYVNGLPPGAPFVYAVAEQALSTVPGLIVLGGEIVNPPGDVDPSSSFQVLRTSYGLVTVGVCEVAAA